MELSLLSKQKKVLLLQLKYIIYHIQIWNVIITFSVFTFILGTSCTGNVNDEFSNTLGHYNPNNCKHPYHAGDMPPLFENSGYAYLSFLTNRFHIKDIIGKTVIIHDMPDDFRTDPSGSSGNKIACGIIQ